uniref:WAP domain-containing protein n=1 Tax=Strigops habroptila TaxID=2489341 RepID=A0A672TWV8_STRHB
MAPWGQASYTLSPKPCLSCSQILAQLRSLLSPGSRHAAAKPGTCPVVLRGSLGPCLELCDTDSGCPGAAKCCTTGCGHICKPPTEGKPGFCPAHAGLFPSYDCRAWCWHDAGCPGEEKCCLHGCDYTCLPPKPGICPMVTEAPTGAAPCGTACAGDWQCPGDEKCCSSTCGHVCSAPEQGRVGACPVPREAGTCLDLCSFDEECPWGHKCCSNGCGHVCTPASLQGQCRALGPPTQLSLGVPLAPTPQRHPGTPSPARTSCAHGAPSPLQGHNLSLPVFLYPRLIPCT